MRKLAAVDIVFLGPKLILTEFAVGVLGPFALGIFTLQRNHSMRGAAFGSYPLTVGVNYVPLLLHAISLVRHNGAQREIADELGDRRRAFRKYRRQSLLLLVPLVVPVVALVQALGRKRAQT